MIKLTWLDNTNEEYDENGMHVDTRIERRVEMFPSVEAAKQAASAWAAPLVPEWDEWEGTFEARGLGDLDLRIEHA